MLLYLGLGAIVGLILAVTGAGGGILAVPLLVFAAGLTTAQAAPIALMAVAMSAASAALIGLGRGLVRYRAAMLTALCGALCAPLGMQVAQGTDERILMALFAGILVHISLGMLRRPAPRPCSGRLPPCLVNPTKGRIAWTSSCRGALFAAGAICGFLSGLLGVGGGFVLVPALGRNTDLPAASVVATSLASIALVSAATLVSTAVTGQFAWSDALPFAIGAICGAGCGSTIAARIGGLRQRIWFGYLALLVAVSLVVKVAVVTASA